MTAIAGIIHFDGAPVARADLERMSQALEPFGRDRAFLTVDPGVGLLTRLSHITPEDRLEQQPVVLPDGSRLLFAGRLDNRPALRQRLGLGAGETGAMADSALAARAWERWGREALSALIGHFTLAHWQPTARCLTLARSAPRGPMLYVHRRGERLWFASAPQGLFALPEIPRALDQAALGHLMLANHSLGDSLYQDIRVVQNAHFAEYRAGAEHSLRYWAPAPNERLHFRREEDAWEAVNALFAEVVEAQLRSAHPVGIQMSGGLDSAAVAGQAARLLAERGETLYGYTRVPAPDTPLPPDGLSYNDERPRVRAIAAMYPNLEPCFVHAGTEPVLAGLPDQFAASQSTFAVAPTFFTGYDVLYRRAAADGVRVLLNGASGNATVTYDGYAWLRELLLRGRWMRLLRELRGLSCFSRRGVRRLIRAELLEPLLLHRLRATWHRLRSPREAAWSRYSAASPAFIESSGALARARARSNSKLHFRGWTSWERRVSQLTPTGLGGSDHFQARYGLNHRDPMGDRRLVELCLALPDDYYLRDGIERRLVRLGMAHLIPESIRLDPSRGRQDVDWALRLQRDHAAITQALAELQQDPEIRGMLDLASMQRLWSGFDRVDWRHAPLTDQIRIQQGLMGGLAVGQFVRWFEGRN